MDLNKKKKAELIEIILRKDDIENSLRANYAHMKELYDEQNNQIERQHKKLLENEERIRELNATALINKNKIKRLRRRNYVWFTISAILACALIVSAIF